MDYSKFLPPRKNTEVESSKAEEATHEETQLNSIIESMKAIRETAQVVDEVKVKEIEKDYHKIKVGTESLEFKTERGGK